jgi:hypothetical protein
MATDNIEHKRGKLSTEEEQYIRKNVAILSVEKIAEYLNRTTAPIDRYIKENNLISGGMDEKESQRQNLRALLKTRDYWSEVIKQFTDDELNYFSASWAELMLQFREDVLFSEELEIKQHITLDILINRNLAEQMRARTEVERIQKELDREYAIDASLRDMALVSSLEAQLSFARTAIPAYATEYTKLLDKKGSVGKDLKATRDQRVKRIEDSKSSWAGFIRSLEDEANRERIGDEAELMVLAKANAAKQLGELHTFMDGRIDRPLLNSDTVTNDEE